MKKYKVLTIVLAIALALSLCGIAVLATSNYGTASDPLVSMSYLNDVLSPQLRAELESQAGAIEEKFEGELAAQIAAVSDSFEVVTLAAGQTLTAEPGCEILLRLGGASCVAASSPGMVDCTGGNTLANGAALVENHLYMVTISGNGLKAGVTGATFMIRGVYTLS